MSLAVSVFAADAYPSRTVRLVVPFAAGSATDTMARLLAQELSPRLGQSVVVENKAGGLGQIAAQHVARSAPDGYTLFVTTNTTHSANPHLFRTLPYDPIKDFEPIARTATLPFMLVVNGQLPVRSTAGFLSYAKANPGKLTYASASSTSLVAAESLNVLGHVSMVGVYYKASPQAILDVASGQVQVMVADFATAMPHVTAGRLKVLAVTTAKRSSLVPDAPPLGESVKGFDVTSWNGLFAPAGTPPEIVQRLARETLAVLARPDVKSRLASIGFEVDPLGPQDFAAYVRNQLDYWGRLVRDAGIRPE
ncbi:MAG: tripartite tricarboxylate transporter substrate binding protein [Betaproteobacteria bacterium]|nr:tripartite tricarboxylate transporter substrate binding protein [Betaproteobacteria bacterium]